jgi:8-oxo-dGTP diphosphatase
VTPLRAAVWRGAWGIAKEAARHLLRRPVVGLLALARTDDGALLLVRRGDTGQWALPGGTLEWGETLRSALDREVAEETGARVLAQGELLGVWSDPGRDLRFHAVTVVVAARVTRPERPPGNALEIREVRLFDPGKVPYPLAHGQDDLVRAALAGRVTWE